MAKDEWGVKRLCPHCGSKFYDLGRDPMTCPECGQSFTLEALLSGSGRTVASDHAALKADDLDADLDTDDLDADAGDADLDDDLLEDDDDDTVPLDEIADVADDDDDS